MFGRVSRPWAAAGLILLAAPSVAGAAPAPAAVIASHLSAVDLFRLADQAIQSGKYADAEAIYDALAKDPDIELRSEARYRHAVMLVGRKRFKQAAVLLRALLDEKPGATGVRLELARVLGAMGKEAEAQRQIRQAQAAGLPPEVAMAVTQFSDALHSNRRLGGSLELALAPDSNINRATASQTLDTVIAPLTLSKDARQQSGLGLQGGAQMFARLALTPDLDLTPRISGSADLYRAKGFDDISGSAMMGLEWRVGRDRLNPSAGETWRWFGGALYASTPTASVNWIHPIGARAQLEAQVSGGWSHYPINPLQDGLLFGASAAYERALNARTGASVTLDVARQGARDPGYATWSGGGSLLAWREVGRTTLFATAALHRLQGDDRLFLFPERRLEWLWQAGGGATFRRFTWRGFAPVVRLRYERNQSTVELYDYNRVVTSLGVTGAF